MSQLTAAPVRGGTQLKDKPRTRDYRLDLIRALAGAWVLSVHFFQNSGFYDQPVVGVRMFLAGTARMAFMVCVPLFMMLTGYLQRNKTLNPRYYLGLPRVLVTYLLAIAVCTGVRVWMGEPFQLMVNLKRLFGFTGYYGWYVEMYIGLFLLIPFLNIIWKGLERKGGRLALIATLGAMTVLPALVNAKATIFPDWWSNIYPLVYYFIGAYIADYDPKPNLGLTLLTLGGAILAGGGALYWVSGGAAYSYSLLCNWYGPTVAVAAGALFLLLLRVPMDRAPRWLRWLIRKGSELSLGIYLISWCFDQLLYPKLLEQVPEFLDRLPWYFVMVPLVYLCSAVAAQVLEWVRKGMTWALGRIIPVKGRKEGRNHE